MLHKPNDVKWSEIFAGLIEIAQVSSFENILEKVREQSSSRSREVDTFMKIVKVTMRRLFTAFRWLTAHLIYTINDQQHRQEKRSDELLIIQTSALL